MPFQGIISGNIGVDVIETNRVETELGREIIGLVPHWYEAPCGPKVYSFTIGDHMVEFYNHFDLSPALHMFRESINDLIHKLPLDRIAQRPGLVAVVLESIVIDWLQSHSAEIHWVYLIKYLSFLAQRTNENCAVSLNVVIKSGEGQDDISRPGMQKFVDHLASSAFVYLTIDANLKLLDYAEVSREQWGAVPSSAFVPTFLQPIHAVMGLDDYSAHVTPHGDVIIMNAQGVLAARRRAKWKVFEISAFRHSLFQCIGNQFVATNLLDVVLELSFTRKGALFIYDPRHRMRGHILNPESIVSAKWMTDSGIAEGRSGQFVFSRLLNDIKFGAMDGTIGSKRRLLEIAAVDGAVLFDDVSLLAVGAIVESHPDVGNQLGARMTAARSSYLWGSHPTVVSSDGEISVHFKSKGASGECDAIMRF